VELWRSFELGEFSGDFDDLFNDLQCVLNFAEVNVLDELFGLFVEVISFAGELVELGVEVFLVLFVLVAEILLVILVLAGELVQLVVDVLLVELGGAVVILLWGGLGGLLVFALLSTGLSLVIYASRRRGAANELDEEIEYVKKARLGEEPAALAN